MRPSCSGCTIDGAALAAPHSPPAQVRLPRFLQPDSASCLGAVPRIAGINPSCRCSSRCHRAPPSRSPPFWTTGHQHTRCALPFPNREAFANGEHVSSQVLAADTRRRYSQCGHVSLDFELSREFEAELRWDPSSQSVFPRSKVTTRSSPLRRRLNDGREARLATHMPRAASRPPPQCRHRLRQPRLYLTDRPAACPLSQVLPPTFARMDVKRVQGKPSVQSTLDCD